MAFLQLVSSALGAAHIICNSYYLRDYLTVPGTSYIEEISNALCGLSFDDSKELSKIFFEEIDFNGAYDELIKFLPENILNFANVTEDELNMAIEAASIAYEALYAFEDEFYDLQLSFEEYLNTSYSYSAIQYAGDIMCGDEQAFILEEETSPLLNVTIILDDMFMLGRVLREQRLSSQATGPLMNKADFKYAISYNFVFLFQKNVRMSCWPSSKPRQAA